MTFAVFPLSLCHGCGLLSATNLCSDADDERSVAFLSALSTLCSADSEGNGSSTTLVTWRWRAIVLALPCCHLPAVGLLLTATDRTRVVVLRVQR